MTISRKIARRIENMRLEGSQSSFSHDKILAIIYLTLEILDATVHLTDISDDQIKMKINRLSAFKLRRLQIYIGDISLNEDYVLNFKLKQYIYNKLIPNKYNKKPLLGFVSRSDNKIKATVIELN